MIIAVANFKGGVGKTTVATLLAEAAADRGGSTLLVDADPQASAMRWSEFAAEEGQGLRSIVIPLPTPDLRRRLQSIAEPHADVVIDTPPGHQRIVEAAALSAEVVIVPCRPTLMDLDRAQATLDFLDELGRPGAVVITQARAGTKSLAGIREALDEAERPVFEAVLLHREAVHAAYGTRPPAGALDPYRQLLDELAAALPKKGSPRGRSR